MSGSSTLQIVLLAAICLVDSTDLFLPRCAVSSLQIIRRNDAARREKYEEVAVRFNTRQADVNLASINYDTPSFYLIGLRGGSIQVAIRCPNFEVNTMTMLYPLLNTGVDQVVTVIQYNATTLIRIFNGTATLFNNTCDENTLATRSVTPYGVNGNTKEYNQTDRDFRKPNLSTDGCIRYLRVNVSHNFPIYTIN